MRSDVPPAKSVPPAGGSQRPPLVLPPAEGTETPKPMGLGSGTISGWKILTALGVAVLLVLVLSRPSCIFGKERAPITGTFVSKHLGIAVDTGPDVWFHAGRLDAEEEKLGWERRSALLYRGTDPGNFTSQLTLVVFESDHPATAQDAGALGANEVAGVAMARRCNPFKHASGSDGTVCSSMTARGMVRMAQIEAYFPVQGKAVFVRVLRELPHLSMQGPPGAPGQGEGPSAAEQADDVFLQTIQDAEAIVQTVRALE